MRRFLGAFGVLLIGVVLITSSCRRDDKFFTGNVDLAFSSDTIFFDTVLTSSNPGIPRSFTRIITIRNTVDHPIEADVVLAGGENSPFRINVDGEKGPSIGGVKILANDSIFMFVEITAGVNNDPQSNPLILRDSIFFNVNGGSQKVQLRAWGQDGEYFLKDTVCDATWSDKLKPYVIHDYVYVPEGCRLTIDPGVRIYMAPNSFLFVEGQLDIRGTEEEPVFIEGDRLETSYDNTPGQYGGIWLSYPTANNRISNLRMKNGVYGVICDSISGDASFRNLTIENAEIKNMLEAAIVGRSSDILAYNCALVNNGGQSFRGLLGGKYDFRHCTFAAYSGITFSRQSPVFYATNRERDQFGAILRTFDIELVMTNCIVFGSLEEETALDIDGARAGLGFNNNVIRTEEAQNFFNTVGNNNVLDADRETPMFINPGRNNYHLDSLSPAVDLGLILNPAIDTDLDGKSRDSEPDAGAYEF